MEKEHLNLKDNFDKVSRFQELFDLINSQKLGVDYEEAYEEATNIARGFVERKDKSDWNPGVFEANFKKKYPTISLSFIDALKRCTENYNPPVNIPSEPLW